MMNNLIVVLRNVMMDSLLGAMIPLPRIIYAQAKDGMVFRFLGIINPRFQVSTFRRFYSQLN